MSCEERFGIEIPNRVAASLATVGDAVRFIESELAATADPAPQRPSARVPVASR
jgi:hypothetical protein